MNLTQAAFEKRPLQTFPYMRSTFARVWETMVSQRPPRPTASLSESNAGCPSQATLCPFPRHIKGQAVSEAAHSLSSGRQKPFLTYANPASGSYSALSGCCSHRTALHPQPTNTHTYTCTGFSVQPLPLDIRCFHSVENQILKWATKLCLSSHDAAKWGVHHAGEQM